MKNYFLLIVAGLLVGSLEAKVVKVTSASTAESDAGSFLNGLQQAENGDEIQFDLSVDTIRIAAQCTFSATKRLVIDGKNTATGRNIVFAPADEYTKRGFEIPTEYPGGVTTMADITFKNCAFANFKMTALRNNGILTLENCLFARNGVDGMTNGSALFINTPCIIRNCVFDGNVSEGESRGGAAIYAAKAGSRLDISNSSFINNYTDNQGAAMWIADSTVVKLTNCTFANNKALKAANGEKFPNAGKGGAIISTITKATVPAKDAALIYVVNCTFTGNEANNGAGAIHLLPLERTEKTPVWLINSLLLYNYNHTDYADMEEETSLEQVRFYALHSIWGKGGRCDGRNETGCQVYDYTANSQVFSQMESTGALSKPAVWKEALPVVPLAAASFASGKAVSSIPGGFIFTDEDISIPASDQLNHQRPASPAVGALEYFTMTGVTETIADGIQISREGTMLSVCCSGESFAVRLYTLSGQHCKGTLHQNTTATIDLSDLQPGLYICKIFLGSQTKCVKILVK